MGATEFALGSALAVQRWSNSLAVEAEVQQYFRKFMGVGNKNCIMILKELEKKAGEKITFGLRMKLTGDGAEGDNPIEGTSAESGLDFKDCAVTISQRRKSVKSKGQMSEQRVPYSMREHGRDALAVWFAEDYDQQDFMYLTGLQGINNSANFSNWHFASDWTGRANNMLGDSIPGGIDTDHAMYAGDATADAAVESTDTFNLELAEKAVAKIETLDPMMQPFKIDGEDKNILLMHTYQAYSLRKSTSENDWIDIQKNTKGKESDIFKNSLGEYAGLILHKHRNVIRNNTGSGSAYIGYALLLGAQAMVCAWGGAGQYGRYSWNEEKDDRGNALVITAGSIYGKARCVFDSKAFGVCRIATACANPNSSTGL